MMEAFERAWKHTLLQDKHKIIAETYWRGALEWAKNNENGYCCGDIDSHDEFVPCPRTTIIEEELGE